MPFEAFNTRRWLGSDVNYLRFSILRHTNGAIQKQFRLVIWWSEIEQLGWADQSFCRWHFDRAEQMLAVDLDPTGDYGTKLIKHHRRGELLLPVGVAALVGTWRTFDDNHRRYRILTTVNQPHQRIEIRLGELLEGPNHGKKTSKAIKHEYTYVVEPPHQGP
jgi:hypothetical protein